MTARKRLASPMFEPQEKQNLQPQIIGMSDTLGGVQEGFSSATSESDVADSTLGRSPGSSARHKTPAANAKRTKPTTFVRVNYLGEAVEAYNPPEPFDYARNEAVPKLRSNHVKFGKVESDLKQLVQDIMKLFDDSGHVEFRKLLIELEGQRLETGSSHILVALLGDSGVGKSLLTNALLGTPGLAAARASGASCTQVSVEYEGATNLRAPFEAIVVFKSKDEVARILESSIKNIIDYVSPVLDIDEDDNENPAGSQDAAEGFKTATEILVQLLGTTTGYRSSEEIHKTVEGIAPAQRPIYLQQLKQICEECITQQSTKRQKILTDTDVLGIQDQLVPFAELADEDATSLWPLVSKIRIRFDSPLLLKGLRFVDCPGTSDTNIYRRQSTESYIRACKVVLIAGEISRILTDRNVQRNINFHHGHRQTKRVIVVPTKSDAINEDPRPNGDVEKAKLKACHVELRAANQACLALKGDPEYDPRMKSAEAALTACRAHIRNRAIRRQAQAKLRQKKSDEPLLVIPTSSSSHLKHVAGNANASSVPFGPKEDGISDIREELCEIAQTGRFEALQRYIRDAFSTTVNRALLVLRQSPMERKEVCIQVAKGSYDFSTETVVQDLRDIREAFDAQVEQGIKAKFATLDRDWPVAFNRLIADWKIKYSNGQTLLAFCKKQGDHTPKGAEQGVSWNAELREAIVPDLYAFLNLFNKDLMSMKLKFNSHMNDVLDTIRAQLRNDDYMGGLTVDEFWRNFENHSLSFGDKIEALLKEAFGDLCKDLDTAVSDDPESGFNTAMAKIYDGARCIPKKGGKMTLRRWDHLRSQITSAGARSPSSCLIKDLNKVFNDIMNKFKKDLQVIMKEPIAKIEADLHLLFREASQEDWDDAENREALEEKLRATMDRASIQLSAIKDRMQEIDEDFKAEKNPIKIEE